MTATLVRLARSPRARLGILAVALGAGAGAAIILAPSENGLEDTVRASGVAGPLVYVGLYVLLTLVLVPGALMTIAGGALFGAALGTALTVAGATAGAAVAFLIGRRLGRRQIEQIAGRRVEALDDWVARNGFVAVLYVRLIPLVPFNALNYAAGATAVSFRSYLTGTALGIIPATFAYSALGGSFDEPTSPEFLGSVALVVILAVGAPFVQRVLHRRGIGPADGDRDRQPGEPEL